MTRGQTPEARGPQASSLQKGARTENCKKKRQKNISQMRELLKTSEKKPSQLEISSLREKGSRIMTVKMIQDLGGKKQKTGGKDRYIK